MKSIFLGAIIVLSFNQGFAQTATKMQTSGVLNTTIMKQQELPDPQLITDKKLQADEGSFSRFSLKFGLGYYGPGLGDLSNKNQPNPDGVISNNQTKISGSVGGRYRIDGRQTISFGTGVSAIYPLHGWERTDVNNPYLSYDRSSRFGELQVRQNVGVSLITTPEYRKIGETSSISYAVDMVQNLGTSRFAAGLDSKIEYYFYERSYRKSDRGAAQAYLSFYPNLKYQFSDKLNMNTSYAIMFYNPRQLEDDPYALWNRTVTQRIGLGYSYARDVYFSPYITIYPNNIKTKNSTFSLAATFSVL